MMRKKPEWASCGGLVVCTACGSDEMEMCDVRVRSGVRKRETRCLGCGDRQTTPITAPELPAAAPSPAPAEAPKKKRTKAPAEPSVRKSGDIYGKITGVMIIEQLLRHGSVEAWAEAEQIMLTDLRQAIQQWRPIAGPSATAHVFTSLTSEGWSADRVFEAMGMSTSSAPLGTPSAPAEEPPPRGLPAPPRHAIELIDTGAIHPESIQPREQVDMWAARDYAEQMMRGEMGQVVDGRGDDWTPIVVYREPGQGQVWLADGFHRVEAARIAGLAAIQALVYVGTRRDALYHALGANARHGLRLTNADKRRIVGLVLDDVEWAAKLSDTEIAARCGVTQPFVSKLRGELRQRIKAAETAARAQAARPPITVMDEPAPAPQVDLEEMIRALPRDVAGNRVLLQLDGDTKIASVDEAPNSPDDAEETDASRDEWSTPPEILDLFEQVVGWADLDPASNPAAQERVKARTFYTKEDNGLAHSWAGNVWLNPPYSFPLVERFADKAVAEWRRGEINEMMILVNTSSCAYWFRHLATHASGACFLSSRVKFWHPDGRKNPGARQDQTIFYFGKDAALFRAVFGKAGLCWAALTQPS
jgi:phage N-6-adenine-methyltransferase